MDTNRYIERNNVLFDALHPSGRKGDDSQTRHTNLFFMFGPFTRRSHPYFHPSVSVSHCLRRPFLSLQLSCIFQRIIWSLLCLIICADMWGGVDTASFTGSPRQTHTRTHIQLCCVIVSSVPGGNTVTRLSAPHFMTSLRQIPSQLSLIQHTHADSILFPCMHAFLATDAWCKILLDTLGNFTGRTISSYLFPTCWLPASSHHLFPT